VAAWRTPVSDRYGEQMTGAPLTRRVRARRALNTRPADRGGPHADGVPRRGSTSPTPMVSIINLDRQGRAGRTSPVPHPQPARAGGIPGLTATASPTAWTTAQPGSPPASPLTRDTTPHAGDRHGPDVRGHYHAGGGEPHVVPGCRTRPLPTSPNIVSIRRSPR
jgi:hypothetical protein